MTRETDSRMVVDQLLKDAGWDIFDKSQVSTEEPAADGRADYLLKSKLTRPLCVIETKRFGKDPYGAKDQTLPYAKGLGAPFIILSNGREHYFWDYGDGDARPIMGLPSQADLETRANLKHHRKGTLQETLNALPYPETFWFRGEQAQARRYQLDCLVEAEKALVSGRRRMLFEMATGTGKTLTIAMLMKRWFQSAAVSRVLFLADRIELAKQAKETFDEYLKDWPTELLYGGKRSLEGQVVIGTLDTIAGQLGAGGFGHAYFDLVVTDECHRSIYNSHRATLGHFDAVHIGLTATPNGNPKPAIDRFKYDPLPYIAVSVDMLDTGFDHKEIETLLMLRPTKSATKYAQMRGRGSRICPKIGKTEFLIYDFVGNVARFNDPGIDYRKPKEVGQSGGGGGGGEGPGPGNDWVVIPEGQREDEIRNQHLLIVGPQGLHMDRKTYQDEWASKVTEMHKADPVVQKIFAGQPVSEEEWEALRLRLDAPKNYFSEASLRKAFEQPTGSLTDFIRAALGAFKFPTREQRIESAFRAWVTQHSSSLDPAQATMLRLLQQRVLTGDKVELRIFSQPPFSIYGGRARMEQLFGKDGLAQVVDELNTLLAA